MTEGKTPLSRTQRAILMVKAGAKDSPYASINQGNSEYAPKKKGCLSAPAAVSFFVLAIIAASQILPRLQ